MAGARNGDRVSDIMVYEPPPSDRGHMLFDPATFEHGMKVATFLAQSQLVPQHFRGKPADVLLAMNLARRMGEDPLTILQVVHFVSGKPGWHAPFVISRINGSGLFTGPLSFEARGSGDQLTITCRGELRNGGAREVSVSMQMARDEGWTKNPKYKSMPEVMLRYRAATFFCRLYCPEVLYGMAVADELADVEVADRAPLDVRRGVDAIDAVVSPVVPPAERVMQAPERIVPEVTARSTSSPMADAELLRSALPPLPVTEDVARAAFRQAAGVQRVSEERWRKAIGAGVLKSWWLLVDGMLTSPARAQPEPEPEPAPVETQPEQTEADDIEYTVLVRAIGEAEADLSDEQVAQAATAAGLPLVNGEPQLDGAPDAMLRRYLDALRLVGGAQ